MADQQKAREVQDAQAEERESSLLDQIVEVGRFGKEPYQQERGKSLVQSFIDEITKDKIKLDPNTEAMLNRRIAEIDRVVSAQLNEILHAPAFQELESSWRGLKYLVDNSTLSTRLRIRVLNVTKKELLKDLDNASEFDQSQFFRKVYEEEYGTFGGAPFGALLGNFQIGKGSTDIRFLEKVADVAAAAHAPFITGVSPDMFGWESFTEMPSKRDIEEILDTTEYARWREFRDNDNSRYVALTLPRMLLREPYGPAGIPVESFNYEEAVVGEHENYLWGNAAWALGARVTSAFHETGWCATIRGVESGGMVTGLPVHNFRTESGELDMKCPTEVGITERREYELARAGFSALVHNKGESSACFFSVHSAQKPVEYGESYPDANANARISAQIPYIFAMARFAHYFKVMLRDKIGGFHSRGEIQDFLQRWISDYVLLSAEGAPQRLKAEKPLAEARIDVQDDPAKPGVYRAIAYLRPHFQLEELTVAMRLVARLPEPAKK